MRLWSSLLGMAWCLVACVPSFGDSREAIKLEKRRLVSVEGQEKTSSKQLQVLEGQIESLRQEEEINRQRSQQLEREIETLDENLKMVQARSKAMDDRLEEAIARFKAHFQDFASRLLTLYEMRSFPVMGHALRSRSFAEFLRKETYHRALSQYDLDKIEDLEVLRGEIQQKREELRREGEQIERLRGERSAKNQELALAVDNAAGIRRRLDSESESLEGTVRGLRAQKSSITRRISELELERDRNLTRRVSDHPTTSASDKGIRAGQLAWPVEGDPKVLRGFGGHKGSRNPGIDIHIDRMTTVRAAAKGKVIHRGYLPAFGLVLMLDHGPDAGRLTRVSERGTGVCARAGAGAVVAGVGGMWVVWLGPSAAC